MPALSSASRILAHAANRNHAAVTFADRTTLVLPPCQRPAQVLDIAAWGGTDCLVGRGFPGWW